MNDVTHHQMFTVPLRPLLGTRFQPTGFPNLGAATYELPDGTKTRMLLLESAQSMANHLENTIWDAQQEDLVREFAGMPYVRVRIGKDGEVTTSSIVEAHRLNSPYILDADDGAFSNTLKSQLLPAKSESLDAIKVSRVAQVLFRYDPSSVLHGVFLPSIDGRIRLKRLLSSFIEAKDVHYVESGGVKNDRLDPKGNTALGYGNVPFSRTEFAAKEIMAYFDLDCVQLRAYGLPQAASELLVSMALYKIRRFLEEGLRLRTACQLDLAQGFPEGLPSLGELASRVKDSVTRCQDAGLFASPVVTNLQWTKGQAARRSKAPAAQGTEEEND